MVTPGFTRNDERGAFSELLNDGRWESLIYGRMKPGAVLGHHYHERTALFFFLLDGAAAITSVDVVTGAQGRMQLAAMQGVLLPVKVAHAIRFSRESAFVMMKSLRYDPQNPDTFHYRVPEAEA